MIADLYDFDKTVFRGESGSEFWLFCLKRHPKIIRCLPRQVKGIFSHYVLHKISEKEAKEHIYSFLCYIDAEKESELFWKKNANRINDWFKPLENDVPTIVCSASPAFQIKPICRKLGVAILIATDMDPATGKISGENCKGAEKVNRIKKEAAEYEMRNVYTDNPVSDKPILELALQNRFHVKKDGFFRI